MADTSPWIERVWIEHDADGLQVGYGNDGRKQIVKLRDELALPAPR